MRGEWRVFSNYMYGEGKFYQVGRVVDVTQPIHSGNVEKINGAFLDETAAQKLADELNNRGKTNEQIERTP